MKNKMIIFNSMLLLMTLMGCKNLDESENLEVSLLFHYPLLFNDGTKCEFLLIDEDGKVGILVGSGKTDEVVEEKFIAK